MSKRRKPYCEFAVDERTIAVQASRNIGQSKVQNGRVHEKFGQRNAFRRGVFAQVFGETKQKDVAGSVEAGLNGRNSL